MSLLCLGCLVICICDIALTNNLETFLEYLVIITDKFVNCFINFCTVNQCNSSSNWRVKTIVSYCDLLLLLSLDPTRNQTYAYSSFFMCIFAGLSNSSFEGLFLVYYLNSSEVSQLVLCAWVKLSLLSSPLYDWIWITHAWLEEIGDD